MRNMKSKICAVVTGKTLAELLGHAKRAQNAADMIELRVDYLSKIVPEDLRHIRRKIRKPAIFTLRKKSEGGRFGGSEQERKVLFQEADRLGFDYIDIELSAARIVRKLKTKKIISYHNFQKTPSLQFLRKKIGQMKKWRPAIMKIATMVHTAGDIAVLFQILQENQARQKIIILGMGEAGKATRILFPLLGSFCTFGSISNKDASAPGQMTIAEIRKYSLLIPPLR